MKRWKRIAEEGKRVKSGFRLPRSFARYSLKLPQKKIQEVTPAENISFSAGVKWQGETTLIYHPAYLHVLNKLMQMMTAISPMNSRSTA